MRVKEPSANEIINDLIDFFTRHVSWVLVFKCIYDALKENGYKIIKEKKDEKRDNRKNK
ncbi:MAG: hypothetical protein GY714_19965 [Desulfobacterales bacterium]|nr:hypothetical protein [Desulfobacterales bacterium]